MSSSLCHAAPQQAPPPAQLAPERVLRGRRRRWRGQQASSSSFDCRTCGREFPTFQALGGHRTSHLRRPATTKKKARSSKAVLVHACSACGLGFSIGQVLGGHMRRHRGEPASTTATEEEEEGCGGLGDVYAVC
ncbi:zinc finger protein ZAT11-like [Miscanthus floridulus]|uniref:zinc finger protein ZAT11-like n=1 Tax=Miscanthus floridulus TaxID=154761 RepID=UPI00345B29AA